MRAWTLVFLAACGGEPELTEDTDPVVQVDRTDLDLFARVTSVTARGSTGEYDLTVTLDVPDLGCEQYADWWEVIDPETDVLRARQPLDRPWLQAGDRESTLQGAPILLDQQVVVRVHMHPHGYGGLAAIGNVKDGIVPSEDFELADRFHDAAERGEVPEPCE